MLHAKLSVHLRFQFLPVCYGGCASSASQIIKSITSDVAKMRTKIWSMSTTLYQATRVVESNVDISPILSRVTPRLKQSKWSKCTKNNQRLKNKIPKEHVFQTCFFEQKSYSHCHCSNQHKESLPKARLQSKWWRREGGSKQSEMRKIANACKMKIEKFLIAAVAEKENREEYVIFEKRSCWRSPDPWSFLMN